MLEDSALAPLAGAAGPVPHRRMRLGRFASLIFAVVLAAPLLGQPQPAVQPGGDIPSKFHPSHPPPSGPLVRAVRPQAGAHFVRREVSIPMRDGVRLHTVLILPVGARKAPILLNRTPYSADKLTTLGPGLRPEDILTQAYAELVGAGYILAFQDVRGKFRSGGDYVMNRPLRGPLNLSRVDHSTDAWDSIDWLIRHVPEANGRVGTIGTSYEGFTALMSLVDPHPALKASVPLNPMVDGWKGDDWFHNGAFRQEMISYVYGQTAGRTSDQQWFAGGYDDYATFLRYGSAGAYGRALGMDQFPFWRRLTQHPAYDDYWRSQALDRILGSRPLSVPTLLVGGLWDQEDIYGAAAVFEAVKRNDNGKAYLALGPWYHGQQLGSAWSFGPLMWGFDTGAWFRANILVPFLDRYLKAAPAADVPRVVVFETGTNQWRKLSEWPLACSRGCPANLTPIYLAARSRLAFEAPRRGASDSYVSDPARPVTYRAAPNLSPWAAGSTWRFWLADDQRFAEMRPDVLAYRGPVLAKPLRLAGTPLVHLVASTSGSDSDWVVKLIDVFPERMAGRPSLAGYRFPIAMEVFRGRYRADPSRATPLGPGKPLTYEFALPAVDYVVQPGHRLMVQVQSSWFPLYDRNPQTFVPNIFFAEPKDYRAATQRVFTGPDGSWIGLPIVE
jgi:putative CocE/NonD family hydrolase